MSDFHHALKIVDDLCIGCSKCMNICPTHAIRVRNGKARLMDNRCIDCGECYRICPVSAIIIEQDDFSRIFNFKHRVALVPAVFFAQFAAKHSVEQITQTLLELGFTHVFEIENGARLIRQETRNLLAENRELKPLISTFCPAIVRLVQVKFPALVHHLMLLKPPLDAAAIWFRHHLEQHGARRDETGIFYVTQCAAKIAAIKSPAEGEASPISGVINMDEIYNKVSAKLKDGEEGLAQTTGTQVTMLGAEDVLWSLTTGESSQITGKRLAIDGVHNVTNFLEKLEQEEHPAFDFLELRACDESCAGGVLTTENRFLTAERMRSRARRCAAILPEKGSASLMHFDDEIRPLLTIAEIKPRSMMKLDEDMGEALRKMKMIRQIMQMLPMVDCGACGSPGCHALAEDIVQGRGMMENCIFIQRRYEQKGMLKPEVSAEIVKKIWGANKIDNENK
ncbi:MAG: 4Fe-4S dicluster domain-containing protein [Clostridia bacterium]|nr:4Fe-4S dicluster domain-containing protein [Clostridia bacterium]